MYYILEDKDFLKLKQGYCVFICILYLAPQHDFLKSFRTPITKLKIARKVFVPLLQVYNSFRTPEIEQTKFQRV